MASKKVSPKGIGSGIRMIQYFINRAGKNLSATRKRELEKAKRILQERAERETAKPAAHPSDELVRGEPLMHRLHLAGGAVSPVIFTRCFHPSPSPDLAGPFQEKVSGPDPALGSPFSRKCPDRTGPLEDSLPEKVSGPDVSGSAAGEPFVDSPIWPMTCDRSPTSRPGHRILSGLFPKETGPVRTLPRSSVRTGDRVRQIGPAGPRRLPDKCPDR